MLVSNSGPDAASRAALRSLMERLPGMSTVEGGGSLEPVMSNDPPVLDRRRSSREARCARSGFRRWNRRRARSLARSSTARREVQVVGHHLGHAGCVRNGIGGSARAGQSADDHVGTPVAARRAEDLSSRSGICRRWPTGEHQAVIAEGSQWQIVDTSTADRNGDYPSQHPAVLLERAIRAVDQEREALEDQLAEAWCARARRRCSSMEGSAAAHESRRRRAQTTLLTAAMLRCLEQTALPKGAVNLVNETGHATGERLVESHDVDVVSFTGSTVTGKKIVAAAADSMKKLSLELGESRAASFSRTATSPRSRRVSRCRDGHLGPAMHGRAARARARIARGRDARAPDACARIAEGGPRH